jgi:hypothetical protein
VNLFDSACYLPAQRLHVGFKMANGAGNKRRAKDIFDSYLITSVLEEGVDVIKAILVNCVVSYSVGHSSNVIVRVDVLQARKNYCEESAEGDRRHPLGRQGP